MESAQKLRAFLSNAKFIENNGIYKREYASGASIEVSFKEQKIRYAPFDSRFTNGEFPTKEKPATGFVIHRDTTLNFSANENFVCLACVHLLLEKGYEAKHIVFEPAFKVGHINKPSYGDILIFDKEYNPLVLIENKTYGAEFSREWNNMQKNGGQLFSYLGPLVNELGFCKNIVLFAADFEGKSLVTKSHIITLTDNEKHLAELDKPKTFSNAQGQYFEVWNETYGKSFETKGLFEEDIAAYSIGKQKYTENDLKSLSHAEIKPIYHEFATILRNYAITDFEHSFYTLIDLFLCKITDERNNREDLQFYYKGIARDTPKEYCARLLSLYQLGKKQLFDIEVINREENDIKEIFDNTNRSLKNGLFDGIKKLFEEIKFYNIKKFNFINVENKEEFELNFQILIRIAALIQDIKLSSSETNHFFGDLFEGLLSKNVHQTEGQFFTPLPIVNFIIKSLPRFNNSNNIKVLDYACGAGHFLTELAKIYPKAEIYGIERSQPLSQVAKIATIINGATESHIVFKDALSALNTKEKRYDGFDNESFDLIISNPPYSVKGFLNTLTKQEREQFTLIDSIKNDAFETNNSIECFFVERAKQFLKKNGLLAIILPSSILTNGNIYIKTREVLFEHFNILAIASMGSDTFGSTGTNTIILFAQRVSKNSKGLLDAFITKQDYTQYANYAPIDDYIRKQRYNREDYFAFMQDNVLNESLEDHNVFNDYKKNFKEKSASKSQKISWFEHSSFFSNDLNKKQRAAKLAEFLGSDEFKTIAEAEQRKQFVAFAKKIECDKLNTYIQIADNRVAILQSPPDKIEGKSNKLQIVKFLGYDWSNRKGDEGIKYITGGFGAEDNDVIEDKHDEEQETISAINSIKYIDTLLYDPNDDWNPAKFSFAIRKHIYEHCRKFSLDMNGQPNDKLNTEYNGEMSELLSYAQLSDMIDFSRTSFNKEIKTSFQSAVVQIESKFPLVKLGEICDIKIGGTPSRNNSEYFKGENLWVSIAEMNGQVLFDTKEKITDKGVKNSNVKLIPKGTTLWSFKLSIGKTAIAGKDLYTNEAIAALIPIDKNKVLNEYLFQYFNGNGFSDTSIGNKAFGKSLNSTYIKTEMKIPLPPLDVQKSIVAECEAVDSEYQNAQKEIAEIKKKIDKIMSSVQGENKMLEEILTLEYGKPLKEDSRVTGEYNVFGSNGIVGTHTAYFIKAPAIIVGRKGSVGVVTWSDSDCWAIDTTFYVNLIDKSVDFKYLYYAIQRIGLTELNNSMGVPGLNRNDAYAKTIPIPPLAEQKKIVAQVSVLEEKITAAKRLMAECPQKKQAILNKWLRQDLEQKKLARRAAR